MGMLAEILMLTALGALSALLLVITRNRLDPATDSITTMINALLPQTQCAQCGYPGCRPYAEAIANGEALNRCPPGGEHTIVRLANLLGREALPLNQDCGEFSPPMLAVIREEDCIGCTLCVAACPVDAIVGAHHLMHTVLETECTGCDLCREPCPVDCIDLVELPNKEVNEEYQKPVTPCINCGQCSKACPRSLQPQLLYWFREDTEKKNALGLDSCIVCGLCDSVCPSRIPLTHTFKVAKKRKILATEKDQRIINTEYRYLARNDRLSRDNEQVAKRPSKSDRQLLLGRTLNKRNTMLPEKGSK